jgi:hypothetical protein
MHKHEETEPEIEKIEVEGGPNGRNIQAGLANGVCWAMPYGPILCIS